MATRFNANVWEERYELTSAAQKIALVYILEKRVYMALLDTLRGLPVKICNRIDENGVEYQTLRLDLKQSDCLKLRANGSALLGWSKEIFADSSNKGMTAEQVVIARYNGKAAKNGAPYYECGDAVICGMEVQIKFANATLARIDTICRAWKNLKRRKK